ncbi:hypothetical protein [Phormidium nigroviride]
MGSRSSSTWRKSTNCNSIRNAANKSGILTSPVGGHTAIASLFLWFYLSAFTLFPAPYFSTVGNNFERKPFSKSTIGSSIFFYYTCNSLG